MLLFLMKTDTTVLSYYNIFYSGNIANRHIINHKIKQISNGFTSNMINTVLQYTTITMQYIQKHEHNQ